MIVSSTRFCRTLQLYVDYDHLHYIPDLHLKGSIIIIVIDIDDCRPICSLFI